MYLYCTSMSQNKSLLWIMCVVAVLMTTTMLQWLLHIQKSINAINHVNGFRDKNNMNITIDAINSFEKNQHAFMEKKQEIPEHNKSYLWEINRQCHTVWRKSWSNTEIRSQTWMFTISTPFQYCAQNINWSNKARDIN